MSNKHAAALAYIEAGHLHGVTIDALAAAAEALGLVSRYVVVTKTHAHLIVTALEGHGKAVGWPHGGHDPGAKYIELAKLFSDGCNSEEEKP